MEHLAEVRRKLAEAIRLPLDRDVALGEVSPRLVPTAVALFVTLTFGVGALMSRAPDAALTSHFEAAHAVIESWKIRH